LGSREGDFVITEFVVDVLVGSEEAACCRTFTTSSGVTASAVIVDPMDAETTLDQPDPS
jgi:hypothetical protein